MDALEATTQLTLVLVGKTTITEMTTDKNDRQSAAKWVGKTFETILLGVITGINESKKRS